ncbi:response regulator [Paenibacillus oenotherae]|uniref:Response regulator n=1 Tax=Paenibacillus oenotherae TaxID=1435645 RepID=A0ABS7D1R3_9BACL|nr:response regulator [Paenibacillus oenotherae]MBW7473853.1 response regulator [Paenibacillus oenotherae]
MQLLLVDDEMNVADTLAETIPWHTIGIENVHKAYSASDALNLLNMHEIDIVITDVRMPEMDGLELARSIYQHWTHIKCLLLTAHADFEYAQAAIKNNIQGYMLKPIEDQELIDQISAVVGAIQAERANESNYNRAIAAMRHHLPRIQAELLHSLLQGTRMPPHKLEEQLRLLEVAARPGQDVFMMLVRFKDQLSDYNSFEISLMEYAIVNLAKETFQDYFEAWYCRDVHDYLVFVLIPNRRMDCEGEARHSGEEIQPQVRGQAGERGLSGERQQSEEELLQYHLKRLANQFQINVQRYLSKPISVLSGHSGRFPDDMMQIYNNLLLLFGKRFGDDKELPVYIAGQGEMATIGTLVSLYEPPLFVHLMEAGHWEAVSAKLDAVMNELERDWSESSELLTEAFFAIFSAFSYIAHKSGRSLADLIGKEYVLGKELRPARTVKDLKEWSSNVLDTFRRKAQNETRTARTAAVKEAQRFIISHLSGDLSVQMISDVLNMHPAYLSRLYKLETGENISEYISRLKMEKACQLLRTSTKKIYEISIEIGYQNPHYFIKLFKKHFGFTPQEYRNMNQ